MFALKYTSTLPELQKYVDKQLEEYMEGKRLLGGEHSFLVPLHYEAERRMLIEQVYGSPQKLKEMCFMAFLGYIAKKKKIKVSNVVSQCPFILHLLGVVSYDIFEEMCYLENGYPKFYGNDLYEKGKINSTNYYVSEKFYESCKDDIKQFLDQSGYICIWEGKAPSCSDSVFNRETIGIVVLPVENDLSEHKDELGKLYDGTECVLEENSLDLYPQGQFYQFLSVRQEKEELSKEEYQMIEAYKEQEVDKQTVIKLLATGMINSGYESASYYYDAMENFQDNIYSREALYGYLMEQEMDGEQVIYWIELIRKGALKRKLQRQEISYSDYAELYLAIGKERIDLFSNVKYMPSCWGVLEKFYRLTEEKDIGKVIAVDFDGTLSLGKWPNIGPANEELINFLKERTEKGDKLILWTCREGNALQEAVKWCTKEGLEFDAVNDNIPEMIERYGTNSRKVSCDYYIDDRAVWTNAFGLLR